MTQAPDRHADVGAYVLGVLGEPDRTLFEEHLRGCARCAAEASALGGLEPVLAEFAELADVRALDGALPAVAPAPPVREPRPGPAAPPPLLDRPLADVSAARRRTRTRRLLAVAAAAVLVVGGPVVAATVASGPRTTAAAPVLSGEQHTATDTATGVTATVALSPKRWGTEVGLRLSGVRGPLRCSLVAVSRTGEQQVVLNWQVPGSGYGVPGAPEPLLVRGGAGMYRPELDRLEVRTGEGGRLVTVPL
ncbi:zf-HC2 domain-containing protein [Streptacidiphilus sp. ASG 303]|uniref:zf-HC2 domain-containing protein n=1 Tax=Streptacidiphilus sp. ASG 303 TaxID=2896847 RepID=UPI0027E07ECA|nr:zf-HC2 domain-containing protein [Streptacidiphilus sp. ASG 303]